MGQRLVPSPAPRPQLTEEMLCILVRGAALGRQSTPGLESGMPGPAPAFTDSSHGAFNKLHAPDLSVHQHAVDTALPSSQGLFNQVRVKYFLSCWLSWHPVKATSPGHTTKCIRLKERLWRAPTCI